MWYVNPFQGTFAMRIFSGFIRTMWYVNSTKNLCGVPSLPAFYKDYVVCEFMVGKLWKTTFTGFIRTMWYVNWDIARSFSDLNSVL